MNLNHNILKMYSLWVHYRLSSHLKQKYQTCLQGKHQYHHWLPNENRSFISKDFYFYLCNMIDVIQDELGLKDLDQRVPTSLSLWMCVCFYLSWLNKYNSKTNFMFISRFSYIITVAINCLSLTINKDGMILCVKYKCFILHTICHKSHL